MTARRRSSRRPPRAAARCARSPASTAWTRRRWTRRSTCARSRRAALLPELEAYYDAVPRAAARVEEVGPFTLFVGTGAWPYYARPRLGLEHEFSFADVEAVRVRQRELGVPEAFEWVHETTPSLRAAIGDVEVLEAPLMVLEQGAWRPPETSATIRLVGPDDDLATVRAVQ